MGHLATYLNHYRYFCITGGDTRDQETREICSCGCGTMLEKEKAT
jgi:hypothetical protein